MSENSAQNSSSSFDDQSATRNALKLLCASENKYSNSNLHLINSKWIQNMRSEKIQELLAEIGDLEARLLTQKQHHLDSMHSLQKEVEQLKHQRDIAVSQHKMSMESVLSSFESYISSMYHHQNTLLQQLYAHSQEECKAATTAHSALCESLQQNSLHTKDAHAAALKSLNAEFHGRQNTLLDLWDERSGIARVLAEEHISTLNQALNENKALFTNETKEERRQYKELLAEDTHDFARIAQNSQNFAKLQSDVIEWREKLAKDVEEWKIHTNDAKAAKSRAIGKYSSAQQHGIQQQNQHEKKIKEISSSNAIAESEMVELVNKMERIAKALEIECKNKKK